MTFSLQQQDQISRADQWPIEDVVQHLGIPHNDKLKNPKYQCVFHSDTRESPNMSIDKKRNIVHCFSCKETAGPVKLVRHEMGWNDPKHFFDAVGWIINEDVKGKTRDQVERKFAVVPPRSKPEPGPTLSEERKHEIYSHLMNNISLSDRGREYLQGRHLNPDHCESLGLRSTHDHDKAVQLLRDQFALEELQLSGLLNEKGNFILWSRLLIPWYWKDQLLGIQGRQIENNKDFSRYFNTESLPPCFVPLWPIQDHELWIMEGAFNAIAATLAGLRAIAFASASVSDPKVKMVARIIAKKNDIEKVIISADQDEAGEKLKIAIAHALVKAGLPRKKIFEDDKGEHKDFNDYQQSQIERML